MGYLFLSVALLAGVTKGYCGKKTSGYTAGVRSAMGANLLRMGLCVLIGLLLILVGGNAAQLRPNAQLLLTAAVSGVSTALFVVSWLLAVKRNAYMLVDVFLMLGVLVPMAAGALWFDETVKPTQWLGVGVLVAATLVMCAYNNSVKQKLTPSSFGLLLLCGFSNGVTDLSQKWFVKTLPETAPAVFNFYTYVFAGAVLLIAFLLTRREEGGNGSQRAIVGYVAVMAACLFANSYFKTLAAAQLPSALLYPLNQGAALMLSTAMAAICFKERITKACLVGLFTAFAGLLIINVL